LIEPTISLPFDHSAIDSPRKIAEARPIRQPLSCLYLIAPGQSIQERLTGLNLSKHRSCRDVTVVRSSGRRVTQTL
jgi:hypothetical protein